MKEIQTSAHPPADACSDGGLERIALARMSESAEGTDRAAAEDVRTMEVRYSLSGEIHRGFKESMER